MRTAEQAAYNNAKQRCTNPLATRYKDYGGRGIEFRFTSFSQFIGELGLKPSPEYSLDREDNNGHYEPGNVRWATKEQQRANRRPSVMSQRVTPDFSAYKHLLLKRAHDRITALINPQKNVENVTPITDNL